MPKSCSYDGAQDVKELEKFLFNMKQYFRAVKIDSKEAKVIITIMYLISDAKLWWQTK